METLSCTCRTNFIRKSWKSRVTEWRNSVGEESWECFRCVRCNVQAQSPEASCRRAEDGVVDWLHTQYRPRSFPQCLAPRLDVVVGRKISPPVRQPDSLPSFPAAIFASEVNSPVCPALDDDNDASLRSPLTTTALATAFPKSTPYGRRASVTVHSPINGAAAFRGLLTQGSDLPRIRHLSAGNLPRAGEICRVWRVCRAPMVRRPVAVKLACPSVCLHRVKPHPVSDPAPT